MRSIRISLFFMMLLSLSACYPVGTTPVKVFSPMETIPVAVAVPATIPATVIPLPTKEIFTPTLTAFPTWAVQTHEVIQESNMAVTQPLTITIVYDNHPYDQRLSSAWGFSALVEYRDHLLLFDTGGDGHILMENIRILGVDPKRIDSVVLSHAHGDHTGGLPALLDTGAKPAVYLPPSFPVSFKRQIEQSTQVSEVAPGQSLAEGLWTTGEIEGMIPEQALAIQTEQGLVVITGCAHPGIVPIVEKAKNMFAEPVGLVLGGFHLSSKSEAETEAILKDFRRLEVDQVAPCHCTGESAIKMFAAEYGKNFIQVGVGSVIKLEE